jgi:succinate dehydrogenase / fumarate reductase membrane anchor subunit
MATPLRNVRGLGAAHRGTETFWRQRLTAIANVPLTLFVVLSIATHIGVGYDEMRLYFSRPLVAIVMLAFVVSAAIHMRIGLGEIIEDYVHQNGLRVLSLLLATFFATSLVLACGFAILKIGFGV